MKNRSSPVFPKKSRSISRRFSYILISIITFLLIAFGSLVIFFNINRIDTEMKRRLENVILFAENSLPTPLWNLDYTMVNDFVDALFLDESIAYLKIFWEDQVITERIRPGISLKVIDSEKSPALLDNSNLIGKSSEIYYKSEPIGDILIIMSREKLKKQVFTQIYEMIALLIAIIAAIWITSIFITRRYISTPLAKLKSSASLISEGDLDTFVDKSERDEIGQLAQHLDIMRQSIKKLFEELREKQKKLEEHSRTLEQKVEQRTHELSRSLEELKALGEISQVVNSTLDLESVLTGIVGHAVQLSKADAGTIYEYDETDEVFLPRINYGLAADVVEKLRESKIRLGDQSVIGSAAKKGSPTQISNLADVPSYPFHFIKQAGFRALLALPLLREDRLIGGLIVRRKTAGEFPKSVVNLLQTFAVQSVLAIHNARLFHEIEVKSQELEIANKHKSDFLANMSHEIRTPMNAVIGMTHLLLRTELKPRQNDFLMKILNSANSLLGIINDILDFSKIEAGKLEIESVDFCIDDVIDGLLPSIAMKSQEKSNIEVLIDVSENVPRMLKGDPLRLGQVLNNLTNNALKFTEEGQIVIAIRLANEDEEKIILKFSVNDTGIGMTSNQVDTLFEAFIQADTSTTRKYGGTGLGLSISKNLIEMMGGKIKVESEAGLGSKFIFTATFGRSSKKDKRFLSPLQALKGSLVLLVAGNIDAMKILNNQLKSFGFNVFMAASGKIALKELDRTIDKSPYDLVLIDFKMQDMNGIEFLRLINDNSVVKKIPTIMMFTTYEHEEFGHHTDLLGIEGYLIKPISPSMLFNTLMQVFDHQYGTSSSIELTKTKQEKILKNIQGAHILLVEDNEINQEVVRELLEGVRIPVTVVNNGAEALNVIKKSEFDAILMDIQMPVMDGFQATYEIRKWEEKKEKSSVLKKNHSEKGINKPIPIIAMTAHAMIGDREKCLASGMTDYLPKPIDPENLLTTLAQWIEPRQRSIPDYLFEKNAMNSYEVKKQFTPELQNISVKLGLSKVGGNWNIYRKLLGKFARNYVSAAEGIRKAINGNDIENASRIVHTIKGLSGNIGAADLYKSAIKLESQIMNNTSDKLDNQLNAFSEELEIVVKDINQYLHQEHDQNSEEPVVRINDKSENMDQIISYLRELKSLLEENDYHAVEFFENLNITIPNKFYENIFSELKIQIEGYDYEKAIETLSVLEKLIIKQVK